MYIYDHTKGNNKLYIYTTHIRSICIYITQKLFIYVYRLHMYVYITYILYMLYICFICIYYIYVYISSHTRATSQTLQFIVRLYFLVQLSFDTNYITDCEFLHNV